MIVAQLVHISGPLKGEIQEFSEQEISIGRHPSCIVRFPADLVLISRNHARIVREGNTFRLVDSSTNGTFVNGKRTKEAVLKNGDVITLGKGGPKFSFLSEVKEGAAAPEVQEAPPSPGVDAPPVPPPPREVAPPKMGGRGREEIVREQREVPLVIQYGPTLRSFKMVPVTIGKNPSCEMILDHPSLLDRHAEFFFSREQYWIRDLTGASMVEVNRVPVGSTGHPVNMNDEVFLGPEGPAFRFLGQGRFVELEFHPEEKPPEQAKNEDRPANEEARPPQDRKSLFKKYFRR